MGVHLPVDAELNDLVKPDEEDISSRETGKRPTPGRGRHF
jgi:hypothetical protein